MKHIKRINELNDSIKRGYIRNYIVIDPQYVKSYQIYFLIGYSQKDLNQMMKYYF